MCFAASRRKTTPSRVSIYSFGIQRKVVSDQGPESFGDRNSAPENIWHLGKREHLFQAPFSCFEGPLDNKTAHADTLSGGCPLNLQFFFVANQDEHSPVLARLRASRPQYAG